MVTGNRRGERGQPDEIGASSDDTFPCLESLANLDEIALTNTADDGPPCECFAAELHEDDRHSPVVDQSGCRHRDLDRADLWPDEFKRGCFECPTAVLPVELGGLKASFGEFNTRHIDLKQACRVRESAIGLLAQVAKPWKLTARDELLLGWAADLHEIGMDIAHSQYHKHGSYLLQNMELPGFSRLDQIDLASLVRSHRRKIPPPDGVPSERILHLTVILRLAAVLHRARLSESMPHIDIQIDSPEKGVKVSLRFPHGWLDAHPLTKLDLEQEAQYLSSIPMSLEIDNSLSQAAS